MTSLTVPSVGASTHIADHTALHARYNAQITTSPTDDYAALQGYLDAIKAAGGGCLHFLPGTYNIGANTLKYQGATGSLTIEGEAKYSGCVIQGDASPILLDLIGSERCIIRNIRFESGTSACEVGVLLARKVGSTASCGFTFESVTIKGSFSKACLYTINSEVNTFLNCEIVNESDTEGSHAVYTSSENDLSVTSDGGTIGQLADLHTNTVINFNGGSIMHYGDYGIGIGAYGVTRCLNLWGTYLRSETDCINIGKSSANTLCNGPYNIMGCSFEGGTGATAIRIGEGQVYALNICYNLMAMSINVTDFNEVYQDTQVDTVNNAIIGACIRHNRHTSTKPVSLDRILYSEVGDILEVNLRSLAMACEWKNVPTYTKEEGASDLDSIRTGRVEYTKQGIVLCDKQTRVWYELQTNNGVLSVAEK